MIRHLDPEDLDGSEFSPQLRAQIEHLERCNELAERGRVKARNRLRIRRALEDASANRRLRDEVDYLR
jgi:hypothetical protein